MRSTRRTTLERLRRSSWAGWFAGLLLVFQVVLAADHLGASAAVAFGPTVDDAALGLLALCHGDGSVGVVAANDDETAPGSNAPVQPCVLCASMALAGVAVPATPPVIDVPPPRIFVVPIVTVAASIVPRPFLRYGTQRGPPISPVA